MAAEGLEISLLKSMPYAVASAREFERFTGVIKEVGIQPFFSGKNDGDYKQWMWEEYAREKYPNAKRTNLNALFRQDWQRIIPAAAMPDEAVLLT